MYLRLLAMIRELFWLIFLLALPVLFLDEKDMKNMQVDGSKRRDSLLPVWEKHRY